LIRVRLMGHIKTSVGEEIVELPDSGLDASALVDRLRSMSTEREPGFNKYNTLAMVGDGDAFVPATDGRLIEDGKTVVLIPFSHGG